MPDLAAVGPEVARSRSEHFAILVIGIPRMLALLGRTRAARRGGARLRAAVRLFLDGCRAH